ncbi:MAG: hypothetical protein OES32_00115 [Acidobacteriota bacterium]|nr:hypothetical protein [Acidobacteriota bacterium]
MTTTSAGRGGAPAEDRAARLLALAGAALAIAYVATGWRALRRLGLPLDDSWIHLQFARSLAAGHGLAFEPGELVAGSTAPLWTALVSLLEPLPGSPVARVQALGIVVFAAGIPVLYGLGRDLGLGRGLAAFGAALYALTGPMVWSAVSGLEVPLFVLLSLAATRCHVQDRAAPRGVALSLPLFALSALARPEGLLLLALAVLDRAVAVRGRWRDGLAGAWAGLVLAAIVLAPVALFNLSVSGSLLPTTFAAKSGGVRGLLPSLRYLHTVLGILFRAQPYMTLLAGAGVVALARRAGGDRDSGLLPALWVCGLPLAYSCFSSPGGALVGNFGRYHYPLFPFVILLGCLGLSLAGAARATPRGRAGRLALAAAGLVIAWPTVGHLVTTAGQYVRSVRDIEDGDVAAARWLAPRLPAGASLAVNDIGAIKYLLPEHRIFDLAGIVTPEVHRYTRAAVAAGGRWEEGIRAYLDRVRPDYLVVFPSWFPGLLASDGSFRPIREFSVPGNIALGGDRLAIYSTPWTREEVRP